MRTTLTSLCLLLASCASPNTGSNLDLYGTVDMFMPCTPASCARCDPDTLHCVGCLTDDHCPSGYLCKNKSCAPGCSMSHGCGDAGACDPNGMCKICTLDADCSGGTPRCDPGSGRCVPCLPQNDNCPAGQFCTQVNAAWQCLMGCKADPDCKPDGGIGKCCGNVCVDSQSDGAHCGACGKSCNNGDTCCASSCSDTRTDLAHCGGCGRACAGKNATWSCAAGTCAVTACMPPFADCNSNPMDGCEANTASDGANCGMCGKTCFFANASASCTNGACALGPCAMGFANCDGNPLNGCEANLAANAQNCGMCGKACPGVMNGFPGCLNAMCLLGGCFAGFDDCDKQLQNGCEAKVDSDVANCGLCGKVCPVPANAAPTCTNNQCGLGPCNAGFANCNNQPGDGCEVNLTADKNHCGMCGKTCPNTANVASTVCGNSACSVATCNANFADCDGSYPNGCEINTSTNVNHCGMCGRVCQNGQICQNGACLNGPVCDPATEVTFQNRCYYLDGSGGKCDLGYVLASQTILNQIAGLFVGKNYKHAISDNCCIWNADPDEDWGMASHCNANGPFTNGDPALGAQGCTNQVLRNPKQLTFCVK